MDPPPPHTHTQFQKGGGQLFLKIGVNQIKNYLKNEKKVNDTSLRSITEENVV